jgi:hypothetical protein
MPDSNVAALAGADTLIINQRIFNDFADADTIDLDFPNGIATVKKGKNGNALFALNTQGQIGVLKIGLVRASADDVFLLNLLNLQNSNFAGFTLLTGQYVKNVGDGASNISADTYLLSGGVFQKQTPGKENVEGNTDQAKVMYEIHFSKALRIVA